MKLIPRGFAGKAVRGYSFYCPACAELHSFNVSGSPPLWNFNGDLEAPTFAPSLRYVGGNQCHLFVTKGKIVYCGDCLHGYAGKTVDMVELDERGQPMSDEQKPEAKPAEAPADKPKEKGTHRPECGEVGQTGEHGDLGSNAG